MCSSVHGQWQGPTTYGCQDFDTWHFNPQFHLKAIGPNALVPIHVFLTLIYVFFSLMFSCHQFCRACGQCFPWLVTSSELYSIILSVIKKCGVHWYKVHVSSWCRATFGNYQFVGEASLFLLTCTLLKPRVKNQLEIFMQQVVSGTNYINSREMFCEMVIEANPKGYTICRPHRVQINKPNFCLVFTKTSITLEPF
jgi:hypothetical protein